MSESFQRFEQKGREGGLKIIYDVRYLSNVTMMSIDDELLPGEMERDAMQKRGGGSVASL